MAPTQRQSFSASYTSLLVTPLLDIALCLCSFGCNLAHKQYSWNGKAADGGYIGADVLAFVSSVASSAAGVYLLTLLADADIRADLAIRPSQRIHISGDVHPRSGVARWGSGSFEVQPMGELVLAHVVLAGRLVVSGGIVRLEACVVNNKAELTVEAKGRLTISSTKLSLTALGPLVSGANLKGEGSRVSLVRVTVPENPSMGLLMGSITAGKDAKDPRFSSPSFRSRVVPHSTVKHWLGVIKARSKSLF